MEQGGVDRHISQLPQRAADGLHRLHAPARRRYGRRNGGVQGALHRQRNPRIPARRARGRAHTQPRVLLPWRHKGFRLPALQTRRLQVGLRADPAQLSRLEARQADKRPQHRCRIPLRGARQARNTRRDNGAALGRQALQHTAHARSRVQAARARNERGVVGVQVRGQLPAGTDGFERNGENGAPRGQSPRLFAPQRAHARGIRLSRRGGRAHDGVQHDSLQRLQVLHAVPVFARHTGDSLALQQVPERAHGSRKQA